MAYAEYRDEMNGLISEMEATTPHRPDGARVLAYRQRVADLRQRRLQDLAAVIGMPLDDDKLTAPAKPGTDRVILGERRQRKSGTDPRSKLIRLRFRNLISFSRR